MSYVYLRWSRSHADSQAGHHPPGSEGEVVRGHAHYQPAGDHGQDGDLEYSAAAEPVHEGSGK